MSLAYLLRFFSFILFGTSSDRELCLISVHKTADKRKTDPHGGSRKMIFAIRMAGWGLVGCMQEVCVLCETSCVIHVGLQMLTAVDIGCEDHPFLLFHFFSKTNRSRISY